MAVHNKFFTGCTHYFHANVLRFVNDQGHRVRGQFSHPDKVGEEKALEEMHEYMIGRWNDVVKYNDYVYHLGDVTFNYGRPFNALMSRLNGRKRLIVGNHDKLKGTSLMNWFEKVEYWKGFQEHDFACTHVPHLLPVRKCRFNVHAHTHQNFMDELYYINVCSDVRDHTPVHLDQILKEIAQAKRKLNK